MPNQSLTNDSYSQTNPSTSVSSRTNTLDTDVPKSTQPTTSNNALLVDQNLRKNPSMYNGALAAHRQFNSRFPFLHTNTIMQAHPTEGPASFNPAKESVFSKGIQVNNPNNNLQINPFGYTEPGQNFWEAGVTPYANQLAKKYYGTAQGRALTSANPSRAWRILAKDPKHKVRKPILGSPMLLYTDASPVTQTDNVSDQYEPGYSDYAKTMLIRLMHEGTHATDASNFYGLSRADNNKQYYRSVEVPAVIAESTYNKDGMFSQYPNNKRGINGLDVGGTRRFRQWNDKGSAEYSDGTALDNYLSSMITANAGNTGYKYWDNSKKDWYTNPNVHSSMFNYYFPDTEIPNDLREFADEFTDEEKASIPTSADRTAYRMTPQPYMLGLGGQFIEAPYIESKEIGTPGYMRQEKTPIQDLPFSMRNMATELEGADTIQAMNDINNPEIRDKYWAEVDKLNRMLAPIGARYQSQIEGRTHENWNDFVAKGEEGQPGERYYDNPAYLNQGINPVPMGSEEFLTKHCIHPIFDGSSLWNQRSYNALQKLNDEYFDLLQRDKAIRRATENEAQNRQQKRVNTSTPFPDNREMMS